jgi:zinc transport system substrate-binding protein
MFSFQPLLLLFIGLLSISQTVLSSSDNRVISSIRPLQMITNEIMGESGQASLLIDNSQNPHHFQLRPSQLKLLASAGLLIWVSDDFETGLQKLQGVLHSNSKRLEIIPQLDSTQLIGEGHDLDGHVWLSPDYAIQIAQLITEKLITLYPAQQALYEANRDIFIDGIRVWKNQHLTKLKNLDGKYILDHPFLSYFEQGFQLKNAGTIRQAHDQAGNIKHLNQLHKKLASEAVNCLLVSNLPLSKQAEQLSQRYALSVFLIDILNNQHQYLSLLDLYNDIISKIQACEHN